MKRHLTSPLAFGVFTALGILLICVFINVPMYDAVFNYKRELVDFQAEGKASLRYLLGMDLEQAKMMDLEPTSLQLKPIGYVLFILIHLGLPLLVMLRFRFANARKDQQNRD
ncbi:MAG: hypothetical protein IT221_05345 [Fluviicola sp.]|jgi:hypothetical protein|nr:hypothetical protein [Fluviicola sp.]